MPKPTKYNKETEEAICKAIRLGATFKDAAGKAGIGYTTLNEWRNSNPSFASEVDRAELDWKLARIQRIMLAGQKGDWRADLALLERRYKDEYALKTFHDVHLSVSEGVDRAAELVAAIIVRAVEASGRDDSGTRRLPKGPQEG